jgi:hypothetical protein
VLPEGCERLVARTVLSTFAVGLDNSQRGAADLARAAEESNRLGVLSSVEDGAAQVVVRRSEVAKLVVVIQVGDGERCIGGGHSDERKAAFEVLEGWCEGQAIVDDKDGECEGEEGVDCARVRRRLAVARDRTTLRLASV